MSGWDTLKKAVSVIAPTVASVIGGPIAGVAVSQLSSLLLGKPDGSPDELLTAFNGASADKLLQLKQLEADTQIKLKQLELDVSKLDYDDTSNARQRQIEMAKYTGKGDVVQDSLAIILLVGVFALITALFTVPIPKDSMQIIYMVAGTLLGTLTTVFGFYFGSSKAAKLRDFPVVDNKK